LRRYLFSALDQGLTGLDTEALGQYFADLAHDMNHQTDRAAAQVHFDLDMSFSPYQVTDNKPVCDDISVVTLDGSLDIRAGEYVLCLDTRRG
jgi:dihydroorotate dehydrogenase (NAD+) catalytic subunit